jgi:ribosomal protein L19
MEAKKKPAKKDKTERNINDFAVGDRVKVNMHRGRIVEAEIKAVVEKTHGVRLQVSFGNETALIYLWQVVKTNNADRRTA